MRACRDKVGGKDDLGEEPIVAELSRPIDNRILGGVCAGLARRFGWNVAIVRLLTVLSIFIPGPQVLAYIVLWIVIPGERRGGSAGPLAGT